MPSLDIEVYKSVKAESDRVSAIMSDLIAGKITAQEAEKRLGSNYSSFARKKLNKRAWTISRVVKPLQDTMVYNHELMSNLRGTVFGAFCEMVFGSEITEFTEGFFSSFLPFVASIVKNVDETEQKWFEKFFKGSTWLSSSNTGDFLVAVSSTHRVSNTRYAFAEKSIATIIKEVSRSWYISEGKVFRYLDYFNMSERLLHEEQLLLEVDGIVVYRPKKRGSLIEPCLTVDLFSPKIRNLLRDKGFVYLEDLTSLTKIGLQSFGGLGISSFWKIEDVMNSLGYKFKVVEV